jgi:hypothetical protein
MAAKNEFLKVEPEKRLSEQQKTKFSYICSTEFNVIRKAFLSVAPLLGSLHEDDRAFVFKTAVGSKNYIPRDDLAEMMGATPTEFKLDFFNAALRVTYSRDGVFDGLEKTIADSPESGKAGFVYLALQNWQDNEVKLFGVQQLARLPVLQDRYLVPDIEDYRRKISLYQHALQILAKGDFPKDELFETIKRFQTEKWPDMIKILMKKSGVVGEYIDDGYITIAKGLVSQLPKDGVDLILKFLGDLKNHVEEAEKPVRKIIGLTKDYSEAIERTLWSLYEPPTFDIKQEVERILYGIQSSMPYKADEAGVLCFDCHFRNSNE